MAKRFIAVTVCLIIIMLSFSGCFGRMKANESFAVPILDEPTSLDPQIADSDSERMIVLNCYEGLLRINSNGALENGVAEKYTVSDDGLTYTFQLRRDAHWAMFSGHKSVLGDDYRKTFDINVYAEDFSFAFDRVFDEQIASPYATVYDCIESYKAEDKYTFTVKLKYRNDGFLYSLTFPGAMPCDREFYEKTGGKYGLDAKYMLCNGAFNVSRWTEGSSIRIVRNDDYNGVNKIMPASLTFYINSSESAVAEKMETGIYDVAFLGTENFNNLKNKSAYNIQSFENTVYSFIFNQSDKYLENRNIRLAIACCIDSSTAKSVSEDYHPADSIVPPCCKIGDESYSDGGSEMFEYNEQKAKEYFEAGLLELGTSSAELEIKCTARYEQLVKQLVQIMQKTLGVKFIVTVNVLGQSEINAAVSDGNYSIVFYPFVANSSNTNEFLESFENNRLFNYSSEQYSDALASIRSSLSNYVKLKQNCRAAERILVSDAVMVPVIFENSYFLTGKNTAGIYFYSSRSNIVFMGAVKK